jgi:hypothetical protein
MPSKRTPAPKGPDWPADKTMRVLRQQQEALQGFKGRVWRQVEHEEDEWVHLTSSVIVHGFGERSRNIDSFNMALHAGQRSMMGTSEQQLQKNFELRNSEFQSVISSSIKELELSLPESDLQGAYGAGDEFAFYIDLKGILAKAGNEVFIIDNYLNSEFFELYVTPIPKGVPIRILTDELRGNTEAVAKTFAGRGNFELRSSKEVHDRHVFVDGRGWTIGQSIKDAARKKPTYMVELGSGLVAPLQAIYEGIWTRAATVVKG